MSTSSAFNKTAPTVAQARDTSSTKSCVESNNSCSNDRIACPFHKFNPQVYDECKRYHFKRLSDMKQHLSRRHLLGMHSCTVCWSQFNDEPSKIHHLQDGSCQPRPQPEKLSVQELNQVINLRREGGVTDQWLAIWRELFHGFPPPSSPYVQANQIEEVKEMLCGNAEAVFLARFPALLQQYNTEQELSLFFRSILDKGYEDFCRMLPKSRHLPLSHLQLNHESDGSQGTEFDPILWSGDISVDFDADFGQDATFFLADFRVITEVDHQEFESYCGTG
ncbi:unnamed protein product [Clonostachys rosea]|uniref:C2H2-type domain-containing protein n=1 Tax=Bionectria ochroleuca TaxID=29856 RepID=A0ABY6U0D5_BIOOC|nr:unnamed protein product [Clonostachys rosea]